VATARLSKDAMLVHQTYLSEEKMEVWIKSLEVDMQVKQKGIELEVRAADGKTQLGDCYATMTGLVWCKGRVKKENGVKLSGTTYSCSALQTRF
jgi:hypothetical protein